MRGAVLDDCIMQVLGVKKITTNSDKERYRLLLSDGKYIISYAMLSTQVTNGEITAFSIIKIKKYITSVLGNSGKSDKYVYAYVNLTINLYSYANEQEDTRHNGNGIISVWRRSQSENWQS